MPIVYRNYENQQETQYLNTKYYLKHMSELEEHEEDYRRNKYEGFMKYMTENVRRNLRRYAINADASPRFFISDDFLTDLLKGKTDEMPKISSAKDVSTTVDDVISPTEAVYNDIMPIYRALREDYQSRSIFQWIFNHREYVASRDAFKAVGQFIKTLTGEGDKELQEAYDQHKAQFPKIEEQKAETEEKVEEKVEEQVISKEFQARSDEELERERQLEEQRAAQEREERERRQREAEERERTKRERIQKEELEKFERDQREVEELDNKTTMERGEALERNFLYREKILGAIRENLKGSRVLKNTNSDIAENELLNVIADAAQKEGNSPRAMANTIFNGVSQHYITTTDVTANHIMDAQSLTDCIMNVVAFPKYDRIKLISNAGLILRNRKDLASYFNVKQNVVQAAKNEYMNMINEDYAIMEHNAMERQAKGEYVEGEKAPIKVDLDEKETGEVAPQIKDDEEEVYDFSLDNSVM